MAFEAHRKSHLEFGSVYFWTATIHQWQRLLEPDEMKMEIIGSLQWLKQRSLVDLYGYVIMPNHLHFIWRVNGKNGKESPQGSLLKYTAHRFKYLLKQNNASVLNNYQVHAPNKLYEFWQRDSLAILLYSRDIILQKMEYIHHNPLQPHWQLANTPEAYRFSSAAFYETGFDEFGILTHIGEVY